MAPQPAVRFEPVVRQQFPALLGQQDDGLDQVVADRVADEVVEVHPGPAGLDALAPDVDLLLDRVGGGASMPSNR